MAEVLQPGAGRGADGERGGRCGLPRPIRPGRDGRPATRHHRPRLLPAGGRGSRRDRHRRCRRVPRPGPWDDRPGPAGGGGRRSRDLHVRGGRASLEPADDRLVARQRILRSDAIVRRRDTDPGPDLPQPRGDRALRGSREDRGGRGHPGVPRPALHRGARRLQASRLDRGRGLPQSHLRRLRRPRLPREPEG